MCRHFKRLRHVRHDTSTSENAVAQICHLFDCCLATIQHGSLLEGSISTSLDGRIGQDSLCVSKKDLPAFDSHVTPETPTHTEGLRSVTQWWLQTSHQSVSQDYQPFLVRGSWPFHRRLTKVGLPFDPMAIKTFAHLFHPDVMPGTQGWVVLISSDLPISGQKSRFLCLIPVLHAS